MPKPLGNIYFGGGPFTTLKGNHGVQHSPKPTPPPTKSQYQQSVENKGTDARTSRETRPGGLNDRSGPAQDSANCNVGTSATNIRPLEQTNRGEGGNQQQRQQITATATGQPPVGHPLNVEKEGGGGVTVSDQDEEEQEEERILNEIETGILDVFGDVYMNKHLMYSIIELVLARLMPELSERGVAELLDERLS